MHAIKFALIVLPFGLTISSATRCGSCEAAAALSGKLPSAVATPNTTRTQDGSRLPSGIEPIVTPRCS